MELHRVLWLWNQPPSLGWAQWALESMSFHFLLPPWTQICYMNDTSLLENKWPWVSTWKTAFLVVTVLCIFILEFDLPTYGVAHSAYPIKGTPHCLSPSNPILPPIPQYPHLFSRIGISHVCHPHWCLLLIFFVFPSTPVILIPVRTQNQIVAPDKIQEEPSCRIHTAFTSSWGHLQVQKRTPWGSAPIILSVWTDFKAPDDIKKPDGTSCLRYWCPNKWQDKWRKLLFLKEVSLPMTQSPRHPTHFSSTTPS